jgi:hypothetical protein
LLVKTEGICTISCVDDKFDAEQVKFFVAGRAREPCVVLRDASWRDERSELRRQGAIVEVTGTHRPLFDDTGELQHPVGRRGLARVDVGDDAEVPNLRRRGEGPVGETC